MFDKLHKLKKLSIHFQGQYMNRLLVHIFQKPSQVFFHFFCIKRTDMLKGHIRSNIVIFSYFNDIAFVPGAGYLSLFGCLPWTCRKFAKRNRKVFQKSFEKRKGNVESIQMI